MQAYVALHHQIHQTLDHPVLIEPKNLRVLVIDSKGPDRTKVIELLRDCQYQVTGVKTGKEAFGLLAPHSSGATEVPFDLILKEHEPPHANACRLLRKLGKFDHLRQVPVVVISTQDDRDLVARCLSYGATDYLVKPLRHNELRNIWTRIWWSRRIAGSMQSLPLSHVVARGLHYPDSLSQEGSSSAEEETKCDDEEEPTSKEGSAPGNGAGNGSNGNGSNGSKEGNGTSRVEAKAFTNNGHGSNNGNGNGSSDNKNGNGSSDNKNGNGNSATKNGHNGSNGNGASTTLVPERPGSGALQGTAEGALKLKGGDGVHQENELPPKGAARSAFEQYKLSSRKRPSCELAQAEKNDGETESAAVAPELQRSKSSAHRERLQVRSSAGASTPSNRDSEDTIHPNARQTPLLPHSSLTSRDFPGSTANMQSAAQAAANAAQFAALQNASFARNVPNFNVPGWGAPPNPHVLAQAHAQAQAQAAQNHALANSGFPGLGPFNPYGLPPHMLQQLPPHPLLYPPGGAPGNPPGAPPPGMFDLAQQQLMAEAVNAANMAQNGANAQLDAQLHHQRMLAIYNSMMYGLPPHAQQQQAQSQQHPHPQHTQQPQLVGSAVGQNWRPPFAHAPFMPPHMPTQQHAPQQLTPAPQSIPETSLASGGGKGVASHKLTPGGCVTGTNGASGSNRNRPSGSATEAPRRTARAAAIEKYRKKRKNLKFSKTIRYESRKALAQQRPRVKGQFVKQANGEGADASTGGGNSKRPYWQEDYEQYDEEDLDEEDENEDEMEEKEKDEDLDMDVVNSLCELKEGPAGSRGGVSKGQNGADGADSVDRRGTAHTQPVTPKAASSQGGPSHGSRGTHHHVAQHRGNMYLQRANSHHSADVCGTAHHDAGRMALLQRQSPPPHEPPHNQNAGNKHGRNGNGGSDSGSNSPDENGGNGKAEHGQHHTHTHGHATAHGHGRS